MIGCWFFGWLVGRFVAHLLQCEVDRQTAVLGNVELPAELAHKTDSQRPDGVAGNLVVTGQ